MANKVLFSPYKVPEQIPHWVQNFKTKYRRTIIYNQCRVSIQNIIKRYKYKGVKILKGHTISGYIHLLINMLNFMD